MKEDSGLFIWLGEDEEPTEHILNEIYERREAYAVYCHLEDGSPSMPCISPGKRE